MYLLFKFLDFISRNFILLQLWNFTYGLVNSDCLQLILRVFNLWFLNKILSNIVKMAFGI